MDKGEFAHKCNLLQQRLNSAFKARHPYAGAKMEKITDIEYRIGLFDMMRQEVYTVWLEKDGGVRYGRLQ